MFKGIHNEAEFYTNFYFDNKLSSDLQSKVASFADIKVKTDKLKGLESFYWSYRDAKPSNESLLEFYQKLLTILGYQFDLKTVDTLKETSFNSVAQAHADERTNLYVFLTNEIEEGTFETAPLTLNIAENPETRELSEVISEFFDELENPPKWILVGSPTTMFLLERNKWAFGKYIKFTWDEIFQQKTEDLFSSILGLISKDSLCPSTGQSIHSEMDDNSHRHAFEVTTELRESVRESIELLINEMIYQKKEKHQAYLSKVDSSLYAKELSHDALFYAYRLIFLLFLEAQAEDSELLPLKSEIYRHGYSLEKLLELIHDIPDEKTADFEGTFAFESLQQVFSLIYNGFDYKVERDLLTDAAITNSGFLLKGIKSDLFSPDAVKHLKDIKLRNGVMLTILRKLSLSSTGKGKNKRLTRVSYSNLGINQLGAVYEGLLSYSGFFAQEDLHALKPSSVKQSDIDNGKELDQIYLAPKSIVDKYSSPKEKKYKLSSDNYVLDENGNSKIYKKGSFVYRLAGRDRQKLASFYTPESLTKCTVKYSLKVLFETKKSLSDLWNVKILEPAMGSGAFLNEAVNQIADRILELEILEKAKDLKTPKDKQKRLWEIKYELISKNVYGVDLNPTAIELARFSLWLNCIGAGKEPPQFNGRLKIGNSLIGARFKKGADGVYPWLLLDDGMMDFGKRLKDYDAAGFENLHKQRKVIINSKVDATSPNVLSLQKRAEILLESLISSTSDIEKQHAFNSLKLCCDLWCSLFFLNEEDLSLFPKKHDQLIELLSTILDGKEIDLELRKIIEDKYLSERFFHWELEFASILSSGGFDLVLGNPPWVAIDWQDALYVSDINVVPIIKGLNASETREFIEEMDNSTEVKSYLANYFVRISGYSTLLENGFYSILKGTSKNTYKAFDVLSFYLLKTFGVVGLIQEDGILDESRAGLARKFFYERFRFHFSFINEKYLFSEVDHRKQFSVNVFQQKQDEVCFKHIGNLFLPSTIEDCFDAPLEPQTDIPLLKDDNGNWGTKGHRDRIIDVSSETLSIFSDFLKQDGASSPTFLNLHSTPFVSVIKKISLSQSKFGELATTGKYAYSAMLAETDAQDDKLILKKSFVPNSIGEVILSGPHVFSFNPYFQQTNADYKNKMSYEEISLEELTPRFIQRTLYQPILKSQDFDKLFPKINNISYREFFRVVTRRRVNSTNERSLYTCIIPPGVMHIHPMSSIAFQDKLTTCLFAGIGGSLVLDGIQRLKNKEDIYPNDLPEFQCGHVRDFDMSIARRTLALNGLTLFYDDLWKDLNVLSSKNDNLLNNLRLKGFGEKFDKKNTLVKLVDRDQAIVEIDALTALAFNLTYEELIQIYQVLFPVLYTYDKKRKFDRKSKLLEAFDFFKKRGW